MRGRLWAWSAVPGKERNENLAVRAIRHPRLVQASSVSSFSSSALVFEIKSHYVALAGQEVSTIAQASLELMQILLSLPPEGAGLKNESHNTWPISSSSSLSLPFLLVLFPPPHIFKGPLCFSLMTGSLLLS